MKEGVGKFLIFSLGTVVLLNFIFAGVIISEKYGGFTLYPGENYTINIPFFNVGIESGNESYQKICGVAETTDGIKLKDITVIVEYKNGTRISNSTDTNGEYCIFIPSLKTSEYFGIYLMYENETEGGNLTLASNEYILNFEDERNYIRGETIRLEGEIINQDARIEEGRLDVDLKYYNDSQNKWILLNEYPTEFVNIEPNENFEINNEGLDYVWSIPLNAEIGKYKFYISSSFNAKQHNKEVHFNVTGSIS
jgi:hypothetical protein